MLFLRSTSVYSSIAERALCFLTCKKGIVRIRDKVQPAYDLYSSENVRVTATGLKNSSSTFFASPWGSKHWVGLQNSRHQVYDFDTGQQGSRTFLPLCRGSSPDDIQR